MKPTPILVVLVGALCLAGCLKREPKMVWEPMPPEEAPAFASKPELNTVPAFLAGRWCQCSMSDPEFAKQLGVEALVEEETLPQRWYEFRPDGTFSTGDSKVEWTVTGKWSAGTDFVILQHELMDGKPINDGKREVLERAESGRSAAIVTEHIYDAVFTELDKLTSLKLAPDQKRLLFAGPSASPSGLPVLGGIGLQRMKQVPEK